MTDENQHALSQILARFYANTRDDVAMTVWWTDHIHRLMTYSPSEIDLLVEIAKSSSSQAQLFVLEELALADDLDRLKSLLVVVKTDTAKRILKTVYKKPSSPEIQNLCVEELKHRFNQLSFQDPEEKTQVRAFCWVALKRHAFPHQVIMRLFQSKLLFDTFNEKQICSDETAFLQNLINLPGFTYEHFKGLDLRSTQEESKKLLELKLVTTYSQFCEAVQQTAVVPSMPKRI